MSKRRHCTCIIVVYLHVVIVQRRQDRNLSELFSTGVGRSRLVGSSWCCCCGGGGGVLLLLLLLLLLLFEELAQRAMR